jgi:hypothetical protein
MSAQFLLAHLGHYLWTLYIPPVLIVVFSIIRTVIIQRREEREEEERKGKQGTKEGPSRS